MALRNRLKYANQLIFDRMNYTFRKNIKVVVALTVVTTLSSLLFSCSKSDDYKKYQAEGEILYTGKLDSIKINPGDGRVQIKGLLKADPKIKKVKVLWNGGKDSIEYAVDMTTDPREFNKIFQIEEGIKSFVIYTYDIDGNRSVAVNAIGTIYGPRYTNTLTNRLVSIASASTGKTDIDWLPVDAASGAFATEVSYASTTGLKTIRVPTAVERTTLTDADPTAASFSYRTLYLPQKSSIDTFYASYTQIGIFKEVTAQFLGNTKMPFATSVKGDRWGIPTVWTISNSVKNFTQSPGVTYGGVDGWGPHLAMEAGWSANNMVTIANGKIYQSPVLPAGQYIFEMDIPGCTNGGDFYTVAAEGDEIPNTANIASSLAYAKTNATGTHKISFTLTAAKKVSLGFVGNLENKGANDGTFWRISEVRLRQLALVN